MANTRNKKTASSQSSPVKSRLNTQSFFSVHLQQAKASFSQLWERPIGNVLTLAVIVMALTLPACLYLLGKNIALVSNDVASPSQVSAYLQESTPEARIMVMKDEIEGWDTVASVQYISAQQGLDDLSQYSGFEQALSLMGDYSLPAVLIVSPAVDDQNLIKEIAQKIQASSEVTDVRLDEDWLEKLSAIQALAYSIVAALSVLMLSAVFLIVGNTLRFNVLANKEEIQTMKLIGATDTFILRPYLYCGFWFGLIGAVSAWLLTAIITIVLNNSVEKLALLYDSRFRLVGLNWDESLLLLMLGTFIGCIAARVSAKRHLKEIEPV